MKPQSRWLDPLIAFFIFAICLSLYNATLTPSLSYASPDGNELTTIAATLGLAHPPGYPLFTWLGKLFTFVPIGDVAHRTNLMSATLAAAGVAILYLIMRHVELSRVIAALSALLFGVSTTLWSQAVITEVYAPNVFFIASMVWLLLKWADPTPALPLSRGGGGRGFWFIAFALVFGLSLGMHLSNLGFAPAFALFVFLTDWRILKRPLTILSAFVAFMIGVAQYAWIPLQAATITEPLLTRYPLNTPVGFYVYTLGAFTNLRFAFPLTAMPDRIVIYVGYAIANLTPVGFALGILGMWVLLFRLPRHFWLFIGMWFVNVWFFTQYKVFDLDVFFIPAHFVFAIFVAFGAQQLGDWFGALLTRWRFSPRARSFALIVACVIFLAVPLASLTAINFRVNNRATDTIIPDFYQNVYAMLPRDSVLVGRRAVFAYDAFFWQAIYNVRPDVTLPVARNIPLPQRDAPLYTTVRVENGQVQGGIFAPPRELLPLDAWYIPVLIGDGRDLTLYRASATPPALIVADAEPPSRVNHDFGGLVFLGYDMTRVDDAPRPRVHLKTYWRITQPRAYVISTRVDGTTLETHDLGFGNLARYVRENRVPRDGVIVEEYDLVIPSYLKRGAHRLQIGTAEFAATGISVEWVDAGSVLVK
ncbi:MAG: DUF2723 domain-containing protein [Chloroflexi bacterium]|nr:DUF2723 domain-containing protein [Chloroflexota bacterium]